MKAFYSGFVLGSISLVETASMAFSGVYANRDKAIADAKRNFLKFYPTAKNLDFNVVLADPADIREAYAALEAEARYAR